MEGRYELHEDGPGRDEEVCDIDGDERPVESEAPDVGAVVEVFGSAGRRADGPVEGGKGRGSVAKGWGARERGHGRE